MPNRRPFRLNQSGLLLALISAAFTGQANAAAGRVDFTTGGVTVSGTDGRERPLLKGTDLDSGDTVKTNNGRAQIRFTDGAYVSLQPNTDFSIKEYNYDGKADGTERGFFGLAKGAMRAVTGLIGRVNRNRYQITTPTATVGIRGTGGLIAVNNDGSTTITGTSGIWTMTNPAGTLDVPAGKVGVAPTTPNEPPKQTSDQVPNVGPTPPLLPPTFVQGDQRTPTGDPVLGNQLPPIVSGSGFAVGSAFRTTINESITSLALVVPGADVTLDGQGRVISYTAAGGVSSATLLDPVNGHAEANNIDGLAWGRWIGTVQNCISGQPSCRTDTYDVNEGFHYVVGIPTAVMPTSGTGIAYVQFGATQPTFSDGHLAPGTFTGQLTVGFTPTGANVGLDMKVSMADARVYGVSGTMTSSGAFFSGTGASSLGMQIGGLPLSIVGLAGSSTCQCSCTASVQGFFSGTTAERAGLTYNIKDQGSFSPSSDITGAAVFKKQ
jgi:hypothetical protein